MSQPSVLVLGGLGFIGRNFVEFLNKKSLCSRIRVVDKVLPMMANLTEAVEALFDDADGTKTPAVEFVQADLGMDAGVAKAFDDTNGKFDFVFHLAGETAYGLDEKVYQTKVVELAAKVGAAAAAHGVKRFVHLSDGRVYEPTKNAKAFANAEAADIAPWTKLAAAQYAAEQALASVPGLTTVTFRLPIVYGPGDINGLTPRLLCGAVYKHGGEKMKMLWSGSLRMHTVHVYDVCRAMWFGVGPRVAPGSVFNLVDHADTTQESINALLEELFGIKTGFVSGVVSMGARAALEMATRTVNEKHMKGWQELIKGTPCACTTLSPFIYPELLSDRALALDGTSLETVGFSYDHPRPTAAELREVLEAFIADKRFPDGVLVAKA
jgi:nucleoside-diphosphate-sugar epimerase